MPCKKKAAQAEELTPLAIPPEPWIEWTDELPSEAETEKPGPYMTDEAQAALTCGTIEQAWVNRYMAAVLEEVIEACDRETDVGRLQVAATLTGGAFKDQIEQRIAVILRGVPVDGRCLSESEERLECELPDDEIVTEIRKQLETRKTAETILELAKSRAKGAKATIEEADEAIDAAASGKVWRSVTVQKLLCGSMVKQIRTDTGAIMWEREATAQELQEPIPFDAPQGDTDTDTDQAA